MEIDVLSFAVVTCLVLLSFECATIESQTAGVGVGVGFEVQPRSVTAVAGTDAVFHCRANFTVDSIRWQFNWRWLSAEDEPAIRVENGQVTVRVATTVAAYSRQIGIYRCVAWMDPIGVASQGATLSVAHTAPFDPQPNTTLSVLEGGSVSLHCAPPVSYPPAEIFFTKNGEPVSVRGDSALLLPNGRLHLTDLTEHASGRYTCHAHNPLLNTTSHAHFHTSLQVRRPSNHETPMAPTLMTAAHTDYVTRLGDDVTLECVVSGWPVPVVQWGRADSQWSWQRYTQHAASLTVTRVTPADLTSQFVCAGVNSLGTVTATARIHIREVPRVRTHPSDMTVPEGTRVQLNCEVEGYYSTPAIQWIYRGYPIPSLDTKYANFSMLSSGVFTNSELLGVNSANVGVASTRVGVASAKVGVASTKVGVASAKVGVASTRLGVSPPLVGVTMDSFLLINGGHHLVIKSATLSHAGYYQCFGRNEAGESSDGVLLKVYPLAVTQHVDRLTPVTSVVQHGYGRQHGRHSSAKAAVSKRFRRQLPAPTAPQLHQMSDNSVMLTWQLLSQNGSVIHGVFVPNLRHRATATATATATRHRPQTTNNISPTAGQADSYIDEYDDDDGDQIADKPIHVKFFKIQYRRMPTRNYGNHWRTHNADISGTSRSFHFSGLQMLSRYKFRVLSVFSNNDNRHGTSSAKIKLLHLRARDRLVQAPVWLSTRPVTDTAVELRWSYNYGAVATTTAITASTAAAVVSPAAAAVSPAAATATADASALGTATKAASPSPPSLSLSSAFAGNVSVRGFFVYYRHRSSAETFDVVMVDTTTSTTSSTTITNSASSSSSSGEEAAEYGVTEFVHQLTGLAASTSYTLMVQALSNRGGVSPLSATTLVKTLPGVGMLTDKSAAAAAAAAADGGSFSSARPAVVRSQEMGGARTQLYKTVAGLLGGLSVGALLFVLLVLHCRSRHKLIVEADTKSTETGQLMGLATIGTSLGTANCTSLGTGASTDSGVSSAGSTGTGTQLLLLQQQQQQQHQQQQQQQHKHIQWTDVNGVDVSGDCYSGGYYDNTSCHSNHQNIGNDCGRVVDGEAVDGHKYTPAITADPATTAATANNNNSSANFLSTADNHGFVDNDSLKYHTTLQADESQQPHHLSPSGTLPALPDIQHLHHHHHLHYNNNNNNRHHHHHPDNQLIHSDTYHYPHDRHPHRFGQTTLDCVTNSNNNNNSSSSNGNSSYHNHAMYSNNNQQQQPVVNTPSSGDPSNYIDNMTVTANRNVTTTSAATAATAAAGLGACGGGEDGRGGGDDDVCMTSHSSSWSDTRRKRIRRRDSMESQRCRVKSRHRS